MERVLSERGHESGSLGAGLDVCILNTCAVTAESERKSRQLIRRMKKLEPDALIAVLGCYSELEPDFVTELGADLVNGTSDRLGFIEMVEEGGNRGTGTLLPIYGDRKQCTCPPVSCTCPPVSTPAFEELPPGSTSNRTRALLKIQDGCDNFCTYCIVPYIRRRSRSLPLERIAEYAKQLNEQGYKEIVVTGIEISSYGRDLLKYNETVEPSPCHVSVAGIPSIQKAEELPPCVIEALHTIANAAPDARLRLGSLDPSVLTDGFCKELSKIPNLCKHIHLSLQSGCDETLKRMGRKYTTKDVLKSITSIRKHFNNKNEDNKNEDIQNEDCGITADLITGFPGETEDEFNQTLEFIQKAAFSDMHIFPYSVRPGTKAAKMPGHISKDIKKERAKKAAQVANEMASKFRKSQIGKTAEVLTEQEKNGFSTGHSSNYLEISIKGKFERNTIKNTKITGTKNDILTGEITGEIV